MSNIIDKIQVSGVTYDIGGTGGSGNPTVELTQAEYDALVTAGTVSADTYYIITDAQAGDLTNYYTKTETNTLLGGKQATLVSGTNIKTINNESILGSGNIEIEGGGGGKAVSGGTNISITTGDTADTINCTLPISATTQYRDSHNLIFLLGQNTSNINTINNNQSYGNIIAGFGNTLGNFYDQAMHNFVFGNYNGLEGFYQGNHADNNFVVGDHNFFGSMSAGYAVTHTAVFGDYNQPKNHYEYVFGKYNVSNTGSTDADKTLFSVSNGTADDARHNAFEIRQNGDIYLTLDGSDVKLQDQLGGGSSYTAGDGIDITNDVISVTGKADTSDVTEVSDALIAHTANTTIHTTAAEKTSWNGAATNASNAITALGGLSLVKLTQAEYDALATKDSNTLYVING